jgi:hypothetical protein
MAEVKYSNMAFNNMALGLLVHLDIAATEEEPRRTGTLLAASCRPRQKGVWEVSIFPEIKVAKEQTIELSGQQLASAIRAGSEFDQ